MVSEMRDGPQLSTLCRGRTLGKKGLSYINREIIEVRPSKERRKLCLLNIGHN
jgi:hypothetical protein